MKKISLFLSTLFLVFSLCAFPAINIQAGTTEDAIKEFQSKAVYQIDLSTIQNGSIIATWAFSPGYEPTDENGVPYINIQGFQVEVSKDSHFSSGTVSTYSCSYKKGQEKYKYQIPVSVLGSNGGKLYVRIRVVGTLNSDEIYSTYQYGKCWQGYYAYFGTKKQSMTRNYFEYVKINRTNFPGMYQLLKNGYYYCDSKGKKSYYDANKDGWLDPQEISQIYVIKNYQYKKFSGNYEKCYTPLTYQSKISSLKGLHFFPWVSRLTLRDYTASKMDLTNYPNITYIDMREFQVKAFTLVAPHAKEIRVESETGGSWKNATLTKIDLSKCSSAVVLSASGSYFKPATIVLPNNQKNLQHLSIGYAKGKTLNLNKYTNLKIMELYNIEASNVLVNKCSDLRYAYFWADFNLKQLDFSNSKKLVGVDTYDCKNLSKSKIKVPKGAKNTTQKGKWWYLTRQYKNLLNQIYKSIDGSTIS